MNSTFAVQEKRLAETGYSLTSDERAHADKRHRMWAAFTVVICFGLMALLMLYPSLARMLRIV